MSALVKSRAICRHASNPDNWWHDIKGANCCLVVVVVVAIPLGL